jgi:hypothetical protein
MELAAWIVQSTLTSPRIPLAWVDLETLIAVVQCKLQTKQIAGYAIVHVFDSRIAGIGCILRI